ncbi:hypothetical protein CAL7716_105890 (plasmid) [Calothrix sp. PCC 7716]|nr:hypothetical protein CAL7716_105890 [Calothrix sp. PCC 7716]
MIKFKIGNLFLENAEALVNTVNCVGVMGKGIALQFKLRYPENFRSYEKACKKGEVQPGRMFIFPTGNLFNPKYIINFPTKRHWKGKSKIEDIQSGLVALVQKVQQLGITSIAIPPLGCGNGGLDWAVVKPLIESAFSQLPDVSVIIFEPSGASVASNIKKAQDDARACIIYSVARTLWYSRLRVDKVRDSKTCLLFTRSWGTIEVTLRKTYIWSLCS